MADRVGLLKDVPAPRAEPEEEQAPLAWWQLRGWRMDRHVLARVREGLLALAPGPPHRAGPGGGDLLAAPVAELTRSQPRLRTQAASDEERPVTAQGETEPPGEPAAGTEAADDAAGADKAGEAAKVPDAPERGLSEPAVDAVRSTFAIVAEAGDAVPGYFYGQLFARHPRLRALFPPAMDHQRDRLVGALVRIVESLTTPDEMAAYLAQLGRDHRKYGVDPAMYEAVGAALLATLRRFAGPAFTPAAEQAWLDAYVAISTLMIQAADEVATSAPAFWTSEAVEVEERYRDMAVLTIALDQGMRFEAGQHVTVQHPRWPRVWRSYSIAGCPARTAWSSCTSRRSRAGGSATPWSGTPRPAPS